MYKLQLTLPFDVVLIHKMNFLTEKDAVLFRDSRQELAQFQVVHEDDIAEGHRILIPLKKKWKKTT